MITPVVGLEVGETRRRTKNFPLTKPHLQFTLAALETQTCTCDKAALVVDPEKGETVCSGCGAVLQSTEMVQHFDGNHSALAAGRRALTYLEARGCSD